jgi:light-regulated signal transduction histidine kinase (bacteriophytochrome)
LDFRHAALIDESSLPSADSTVVVDLDTCAQEPIHIPGAIQPYGTLIACSMPDWTVSHAADNAAALLTPDTPSSALFGRPLDDLLSTRIVHDLRNVLQTAMASGTGERLPMVDLGETRGVHDIMVHANSAGVILEFVKRDARDVDAADPMALVKTMIGRLRRAPTLDRFLRLAAQQVRAISGFDRVMVYKFLADGTGQVVSEAVRAGLTPFLDLHYPASDIPAQARELYKRQWLRLIPDVDYTPVPLRASDGNAKPLDLSLAALRSVSPIHLEYLRNMGSRATLTISLMRGDTLWGLVSCHHMAPHRLAAGALAACEMFGQIFSLQIEAKEREEDYTFVERARDAHDRLIAAMSPEETIFENLTRFGPDLKALIECDGIGIWTQGRFIGTGKVPPESSLHDLVTFLGRGNAHQPFATEELSRHLPSAARFAADVSGVLAIPFSRSPRDFLLFFRHELIQTLRWGGDPTKPVEIVDGAGRIGPRKSFEAWQQTVRGLSKPWRPGELQIAETLRVSLLDVILRRADLIDRERQATQDSQSLLVAELNHRVKNILALVRSLLRQSRQGATSVESFAADLESRIRALAQAHDELSHTGWQSAPLQRLLDAEVAAWGAAATARVKFEGPGVLLMPRAYQALALVLHEMMTNAAKYGAMSRDGGQLTLAWDFVGAGDLRITWTERGGPPVHAPTRRGFGSVVTTQTIPFELKGETEIEFLLEGVRASFLVPAEYVREAPVLTVEQTPPPPVGPSIGGQRLLLVEDSMMIALDAQAMLQEAGASVEIAGSVAHARKALGQQPFDGAILDINLSGETSFDLADELLRDRLPFVFATGYGESIAIPERFAAVPVVLKPYDAASLRAGMTESRDALGV